ncbi:hypothetical protein AAHB34_15540 [Paenarthrobacter ureafaciens]
MAFAPAAVVAAASALAPMLGAWPLFAMFASSGLFWLGLALRAQGVYRKTLVLSGRIALSLAVPFLITALYPERPDAAALTTLALVVVCAAQQVLGAAFERWGVGLLAPQISALAFGGVGITALVVLTVLDKAPGHPVVAAGVFAVLAGGLVAGMLAFPPLSPAGRASWAGSGASEPWRPNGMEFLAPAAGMVSAVVGAAVVSRGLGNFALLALAMYFVVTALRLPASMHRQCYWWLARATATVLAASAYVDLSSAGYALSVGGEEATPATVIVWVLGAQLVAVLAVGRKAMSLSLLMVDAGVLLALMSIATAALRFPVVLHSSPHDGWQPGAAAIITAAGALVAGVMLRKHRVAWLLAPAAMHLLVVRGHNVRDVEILLGLFTAYAGLMIGLTRVARLRGAYLLAGRVLFTAFATIVVADAAESAAAASLALAGLVFIQIALHPIVRRRFDGSPLLKEALWAGLVVQLLLPCWYFWARDFDGGGRWVVLCELTLAIVAAALVWRDQRHAAALYAGVVAVAGVVVGAGPALTFPSGTWLHQAVLSELHVPAVLLGLAAGLTALRVFLGRLSTSPARPQLKWSWFASALFFASVAGIFSVDASRILTGLAVLTVALVFYAGSHLEDRPRFYAGAASTTLVGAVTGVEGWLNESGATTAFTGAWPDLLPWLVGGVGTGLILYVWRLLGGPAITAEPWRRYSLSATTGAGLLATAILGLVHDETALAGAFLTAAAAVLPGGGNSRREAPGRRGGNRGGCCGLPAGGDLCGQHQAGLVLGCPVVRCGRCGFGRPALQPEAALGRAVEAGDGFRCPVPQFLGNHLRRDTVATDLRSGGARGPPRGRAIAIRAAIRRLGCRGRGSERDVGAAFVCLCDAGTCCHRADRLGCLASEPSAPRAGRGWPEGRGAHARPSRIVLLPKRGTPWNY